MTENKFKKKKSSDWPFQTFWNTSERMALCLRRMRSLLSWCWWGGTTERVASPLHIPMSKTSTWFFFCTFNQWGFSSCIHSKEKLASQLCESVITHISVRVSLIMFFPCHKIWNSGSAWGSWSKCIQFLIFHVDSKFLVQEINSGYFILSREING